MSRYLASCLLAILLALPGCAMPPSVPPEVPADIDFHRPSPESLAMYQFSRGRMLADDGRYDDAVEALREAVSFDPRSPFLRISLAELLLQAGHDDEAVTAAREALLQDPQMVEAHLLLGGITYRNREFPEAVEHFRAVITLAPENESAYLHLAVATGRLGDQDAALEVLDGLLARHPDSLAGQLTRARLYRDFDRPEDAESAYRSLLVREPGLNAPYLELGRVYEKAGRQSEAAGLYRVGIANNPRNETLRRRLIQNLIMQNDYPTALAELKTLAEFAPQDLEVRRKIGLIELDMERWQQAEENFRFILERAPGSPTDLFYLASSLERQQRWTESAEVFAAVSRDSELYADALYHRSFLAQQMEQTDEAILLLNERIELAADRSDLFEDLATLQEHTGRYDDARQTLDLGLVYFPANPELNYRRGLLLERLGDRGGAMQAMNLVLELDPEHAEALNFIAYSMAESGENLEQALALVHRALARNRAPHILDTLGWIYYRMGDMERARPPLEEAIRQLSRDPVIWSHLGDLYLQLKEKQLALDAFRRALEYDPENLSLQEKLGRAEGLP